MIDRRQLKEEGKNLVKKDVYRFFAVLFVYGLLYSAIEAIFSRIAKATGNEIFNSLSFIVILLGPMVIGYSYMFLSNVRSGDYVLRLGDLFKFYNEGFFSIIVVNLLCTLKIILGIILLIVPGILWSIDYSQCRFILACSPDKDPIEVMKESKALMKNRRGEYFMLVVSYIPQILLGIITIGIYFIWLAPYMQSTFALYFDKITAPEKTVEDSKENEEDEKQSALIEERKEDAEEASGEESVEDSADETEI